MTVNYAWYAGVAGQLLGTAFSSNAAEEAQKAQNEALKAYNKQVLVKSAADVSALNVQRSVSRMQVTQALYAIERQSAQDASLRKVSLAATDTAGASARHAMQALEVAKDQAKGTAMLNSELTEESINASIVNATASAKQSIRHLEYGAGYQATMQGLGQLAQYIPSYFDESKVK